MDDLAWSRQSWKTLQAMHRRFLRAFQIAAEPLAAAGWQVHTSRALWRGPQGDWARIHVLHDGWRWQGTIRETMQVDLYSARLMRTVDRWDPAVEPNQPRRPAHLHPFSTVVDYTKGQGHSAPRPAPVTDRSVEAEGRHTLLDPTTVGPWLGDLVSRLGEASASWTSSDVAFRDALVSRSGPNDDTAMRRAAILSSLIGDTDALPALLAEAAARHEAMERFLGAQGFEPSPGDDRKRDMTYWSNERFTRFLERDLPKRVAALE